MIRIREALHTPGPDRFGLGKCGQVRSRSGDILHNGVCYCLSADPGEYFKARARRRCLLFATFCTRDWTIREYTNETWGLSSALPLPLRGIDC
ncbi:MAG: hypothetical protein AAF458_23685 [Pseudomonadota bacterium]